MAKVSLGLRRKVHTTEGLKHDVHEHRLKLRDADAPDSFDSKRDAEVFKRNLRLLWRKSEMTGAELSEKIGAGKNPEWFRSLVAYGLSRINKRNRERLERLAAELGIEVKDFWKEDLFSASESSQSAPATMDAEGLGEVARWCGEHLPRMEKLKELLESGSYSFLGDMIDSLHAHYRKSLSYEKRIEDLETDLDIARRSRR